MKSAKSIKEMASMALDLCSMRYPGFVYGKNMSPNAIPVFCFHGIEPVSFERMLNFLSVNGYSTLHADEYADVLSGNRTVDQKSVVLTFDDGWGSLWSIGFPLLKQYGTKIVVFLAPGRIELSQNRWPTLDDLKAGKCRPEDVFQRDHSCEPLLTWEEIIEMHKSGLVDFQSHSFNHSLINRSTEIVDFLSPGLQESSNIMEMPCHADNRPAGTKIPMRLGEPLFRTASRLSDVPKLLIDPSIASKCADYASEMGGLAFFERDSWRAEMNRLAQLLLAKPNSWRVESPAEQVAAVRFEMVASKTAIEEMLPGKTVRHICYPWHIAGMIANEEAQKAGYIGGFGGKVNGAYYSRIPGNPLKTARVGGDFFFRLPGKGRVSLLSILMKKIARRSSEGSPYLTH